VLTPRVEARLATPHYQLAPIGSFEKMLQYGCSHRAIEEPKGYPILRMNNLQASGWCLEDLKYVELPPEEFNSWRLERGDIVFNRTNSKELVGKCEVFDEQGDWVFASYLMRLRVDQNVALPEFVTAFLNSQAGRIQIDRESRQIIGMSNINAEEIRTLRVPVPPVSKQRQLTATLEAKRQERADKLKEADDLLAKLDIFILSQIGIIDDASHARLVGAIRKRDLGGPLNAERYLVSSPAARIKSENAIPLDIAFEVVEEKVTPASASKDSIWNCLRIDDLGNEPLYPPVSRRLHGRDLVGSFFSVRNGDVLIARLGPPLLNGKIVVVRDCDNRTVCSPEFLVLRPNGAYDSDVGMWILRSQSFRRVLYSKTRGSTPSRYRMMREELGGVMLPKLRNSQQEEIAAEVTRVRERARGLREEASAIWDQAKQDFERALLGDSAN
jgi:type I restriction enzyme, S subunit